MIERTNAQSDDHLKTAPNPTELPQSALFTTHFHTNTRYKAPAHLGLVFGHLGDEFHSFDEDSANTRRALSLSLSTP